MFFVYWCDQKEQKFQNFSDEFFWNDHSRSRIDARNRQQFEKYPNDFFFNDGIRLQGDSKVASSET